MDKLNILWTTDNKDTIYTMLIMYAVNAKTKGWWKDVNIIIWGASAKLIAADTQVQAEVKEMICQGIHVEACKACCDIYGVSEKIEELGIDVRFMGESLTNYLKTDEKILTI